MKNGIIFGKFYPLHIGHIDFIQKASGLVDNLYVVVCTESERDLRLFNESKMKKMPKTEDKIDFVKTTFKNQSKINVLHLVEDGIPVYPTGWVGWSERVKELLEKNKIVIDKIFTNEPQDVENYRENFVNGLGEVSIFSENLEIQTIDISRSSFHISATEVRKNPYKNWFFVPKIVRNFFTINVKINKNDKFNTEILVEKLRNYYNFEYLKINETKNYDIEILFENENIIIDEKNSLKINNFNETEIYNKYIELLNNYINE